MPQYFYTVTEFYYQHFFRCHTSNHYALFGIILWESKDWDVFKDDLY